MAPTPVSRRSRSTSRWRVCGDGLDGCTAVAGFGDDVDVGFAPQHSPHAPSRDRLVVHDCHAQRHTASRRR